MRALFFICFIYSAPSLLALNTADAYFYFTPQEEAEETTTETSEGEKNTTTIIQRSAIKIAPPTNAFKQKKQDLKHYFSNDKAQSLLAGTEEYVIIEEQSFTQMNKGVAILLPDWQQGLTNPNAINFLRKELPHSGWNTLSIQPPNMPSDYPSMLSDKKARIEANEKALKTYQATLKNLMTSVMEKARNSPGIFLVITQGSHAAMLTKLYKEDASLKPTAIIMLSGNMSSMEESNRFAKDLAMSDIPTLDLILQRDNKTVLNNAILRKKLATREMKVYYRQTQLYNVHSGYYPKQPLLIEINGWLKTIGW